MNNRCRNGHDRSDVYYSKGDHLICRPCRRIRFKHWLSKPKNGRKMCVYIRDYRQRKIPHRIALVRDAKTKPCADCGKNYPHYVMDFHHRHSKRFLVSRMVHNTTALSKLQNEIAKCDVVCANCHRERTYGDSLKNATEIIEV